MNARPLAEIIEEGRRLRTEHEREVSLRTSDALLRYYSVNGNALLAVAEDAGRFCEPAEEWLKLLGDPDKVSGAVWTRMNEAREKLFAHFAPKPGDDAKKGGAR